MKAMEGLSQRKAARRRLVEADLIARLRCLEQLSQWPWAGEKSAPTLKPKDNKPVPATESV
jgi:hypothetical protein